MFYTLLINLIKGNQPERTDKWKLQSFTMDYKIIELVYELSHLVLPIFTKYHLSKQNLLREKEILP